MTDEERGRAGGEPGSRGSGQETFAERLDRLIGRRGLSNVEMGRRMGLTHGTIANWRHGRTEPSLALIEELSRQLGVSVLYLVTGQPDPHQLWRAFDRARQRWAQAVGGGADPAAAWEEILGTSGLLTDEERDRLRAAEAPLREFLVSVDGVRWVELPEESWRVVRDLVVLLERLERRLREPGP